MSCNLQRIMGYMRRAITEYGMITEGDHVAVGVSGGKDSMALLAGLIGVRRFLGVDFTLTALSLDNGFPGVVTEFAPVEQYCREQGIPFVLRHTQIGEIVFAQRQETNPCSLCARMRRGVLHDTAKEYGCNKIALGHHYNDAVETFLMNLVNEGRIGCFSPVSYLSRKDLTMIRPLVFAPEREIELAVQRAGLPIVKNPCPVDGITQRQWAKDFLASLETSHPGVTQRIFGALRRGHVDRW